MPLGVAIGAAIAGSVASAGLSALLAPSPPGAPDLAAATAAGVNADIETLAARRAIERASKLGTSAEYDVPGGGGTVTKEKQFVEIPTDPKRVKKGPGWETVKSEWVEFNPADFEEGGKYAGIEPIGEPRMQKVTESAGAKKTADFTGFGDADVQGKIARELAGGLLEQQKEFGPRFIEQRLKELEMSDPEGWDARKRLASLIEEDAGRSPDRPVATELERQLQAELDAGRAVDGDLKKAVVEGAARAAAARGTVVDAQAIADRMNIGIDAEDRQLRRQQKTMGFLTSGATPEDVEYRRRQQSMSNMGSFLTGQTPTAQFNQLSGAQAGASPFNPAYYQSQVNPNAGNAGASFELNNFNNRMNAAINQPNAWMSGLSLAIQGAGTAAALGAGA